MQGHGLGSQSTRARPLPLPSRGSSEVSAGGGGTSRWMKRAVKTTGCRLCGRRPGSLDELPEYHIAHIDESQKSRDQIGGRQTGPGFWADHGMSPARFFEELLNCEILCKEHHPNQAKRIPVGAVPLPLQEWINETTGTWE